MLLKPVALYSWKLYTLYKASSKEWNLNNNSDETGYLQVVFSHVFSDEDNQNPFRNHMFHNDFLVTCKLVHLMSLSEWKHFLNACGLCTTCLKCVFDKILAHCVSTKIQVYTVLSQRINVTLTCNACSKEFVLSTLYSAWVFLSQECKHTHAVMTKATLKTRVRIRLRIKVTLIVRVRVREELKLRLDLALSFVFMSA